VKELAASRRAHITGGAAHWKRAAHWEFSPSVNLNGHGAQEAHGALCSWHGAYSPKPDIA